MRRTTENQRKNRVLADCFVQMNKVENLSDQRCSLPHLTTFHQEIPMKPSQVPNRLSDKPKILLSRSSPELFYKHKPLSGMTQRPESTQCPQQKSRPSSEKSIPANSKRSSHKRHRMSEPCNEVKSKKLCLRAPNYGEAAAAQPTADNPPGTPVNSQLSSKHSPSWEQPLKARGGPLKNKSSEESASLKPSSAFSLKQSHNSSSPPRHYTGISAPMGVKQALLFSIQNDTVRLKFPSHPNPEKERVTKRSEAIDKNNKSDTLLTCEARQKDQKSSLHASHFSDCHTAEQPKAWHAQRSLVLPNGADELFTPDTSVVSPPHKSTKPSIKEKTHRSPTSGKDCLSQLKDKSVKLPNRGAILSSKNGNSPSSFDTAFSKQASASSCCHSLPQEIQAGERGGKPVNGEDAIDLDLDQNLDFTLALDYNVTQSSQSSEDEQLISLQEVMARTSKPPDTPEKSAFSEPSTSGHCSPLSKKLEPVTTKLGLYKNSHSQMLKEINENKRAKEMEMQLLTACKEDLMRVSEYEKADDEGILSEQREFLQRFSVRSGTIREIPPGEEVFNLEKFGQIFNQDSLQLRQCEIQPYGTAQKTLLRSTPAQLRLHVNIGLFQEAYDSQSPCPSQVSNFLFKMMSVHDEMMVCDGILQALCDIACTAACQRVNTGNQQFKVWVPSLADVTLILMNMGAAFVTLYPFEKLQPLFTERDLLEDISVKCGSPSNREQTTFPEHNCNNMLKYLSYCMGLCPCAYSDQELLLLLTVMGRISLDPKLIVQSTVNLYTLQSHVINNIRDWDTLLPRICLALTDVTDDHHNMCQLVHLLPNNKRGKHLRQHLSLCMISKLLDGDCTYRPTKNCLQLSELRPYIPRMQPSSLRAMLNSSSSVQKDEKDPLDQQAYYLCYSLLTLMNEASNIQFISARQKEQLLLLLSDLDTHVKSDIRESGECLYRSKVKDLQARISTKWDMLVPKTRPLNAQLYDWHHLGTP